MVIPAGKLVKINSRDAPLTDRRLLLEEDISLSLQSNFAPLVDARNNNMLTALTQLTESLTGFGFSGQFKQMGFQIWQSTSPLSFSVSIGLYQVTNALRDVVVPAREIMKLPLPGEGVEGNLIAPGPGILEVLGEGERSQSNIQSRNISIRIGNILHMKRVLVSNVEPTISNEVDTDGHPIWVKLKVDITSIYTATTQFIDNSFGV